MRGEWNVKVGGWIGRKEEAGQKDRKDEEEEGEKEEETREEG